jgi:YVTN family beta-propeller protein
MMQGSRKTLRDTSPLKQKQEEVLMRTARLAVVVVVLLQATLVHAQTPSPALLVLNKGANEMAIVDPSAMKVVARVPVGEGPHEVATDGKLAFVANYGSHTPGNTISVIDLATQKEIKRVDLGPLQRPHGIVVNGGKVYFTAEDTTARWAHASTTRPPDLRPPDGFVSTYDPSDRGQWSWSTGEYGTHMLVVSKDGKKVFTTNIRSDSVSVHEREAPPGAQGTVIRVGKGPEGIDISPDGREVWVAHSQDGGISIIDVDSKKVVKTLSISTKRSNRLKFTPDGKWVLVSDMDGDEVVVLDSQTRNQIKRIKTGGHPEGIQMEPNGSRAFVALAQEGAVAAIDLKTLEVSSKLQTGPDADGMAWVK